LLLFLTIDLLVSDESMVDVDFMLLLLMADGPTCKLDSSITFTSGKKKT